MGFYFYLLFIFISLVEFQTDIFLFDAAYYAEDPSKSASQTKSIGT